MYKSTLAAVLLATSLTANSSIILQDGESYSSSFNLSSTANGSSLTDNYWEVVVAIYDKDNDPFKLPVITASSVTLTLFENTDYSSQVYSQTLDTRDWIADYGVLFGGFNTLFADLDGSFVISYNGGQQATLLDVAVRNYAGSLAPSYIAQTVINPVASPVPVPAALWLFVSGIIGLTGFSRFKRKL